MSQELHTKLRISQDGADVTSSAVRRVVDNLEGVAGAAKKTIGKIVAFEDIEAGLVGLEGKLAEATAARDAFLAGVQGRKDAIIGASVDEAKRKLIELETALGEAKRQRDFFLNSAETGGADGAKMFAKDIGASRDEVNRLAEAIRAQKGTIESLPKAMDAKATKEATRGLADYEKSVYQAGTAVKSEQAALAKLESQLLATGVDTKNLAAEKERLSATSLAAEKGVVALKNQLLVERQAADAAAQKTREVGSAAEQAGRQAESGASGLSVLRNAVAAIGAAAVAREFIQANAAMESMTKSLELVIGSSQGAAAEMEFVRAESMRLGLEVQAAASSYTQLAASAKGTTLAGQATRDIWSSVAQSMAQLDKSSADTDGALLAISQMMSKGVVSAEELRGQLGERLPGAFQVAAKAMDVTTQELGKMLENGEILAADFLPKFAAELRKTGGGEVDTFNANLARLKNTVTDVFLAMGDTGAFQAISGGLKYTSVAVVTAWEGFELLGRTLANMAYTLASLDFAGYRARQQEALAGARADVEKVIERLFPLRAGLSDAGKAGQTAGEQIAEGQRQVAAQTLKSSEAAKQLADDLKRLKIDPEEFTSGLTSAERALVESFDRMVAKSDASSDMLLRGFGEALQEVGVRGLEELEFAIQDAFQKGRISAEQLDAAMQLVEARRKELTSGAGDLESAYTTLGIKSQAALDAAAQKAKEAYETIRASGAGVNVLNAAWAKYAEAAIAANGGVADSTIQAEAAMRGYVITVDDAGKATLRLKSVTEDWAETQRQAVYAANQALADHAQQMSEMYDVTHGGIGSMQSSIDDFHAHLAGLGSAMANVINSTRAAVREATHDSQAALDLLQDAIKGVGLENVDSYLRRLHAAREQIIYQYDRQKAAADHLTDALVRANSAESDLADSLFTGALSVDYLDSRTLDNLDAAIEAASRRLESFTGQAHDTVASLRDQLAEMRGEYLAIEQRRGAGRVNELQDRLDEAERALRKMSPFGVPQGDPEEIAALKQSIADLREAIRIQVEINRMNEAAARQREEAARRPSPAPAPAPSSGGSSGGSAPAPSGGQAPLPPAVITVNVQGYTDPGRLADELLPELQRRMRYAS